jgi:hypothetical protein
VSYRREVTERWHCDNCGDETKNWWVEYAGSPPVTPGVVPNAGWIALSGIAGTRHFCYTCSKEMINDGPKTR